MPVKTFLSLVLFLSVFTANGQTKLINPILTGFYPDPSIIKTGSDYYLVNSTFSYFPGIPVFHSKDLKNWKQVGNVISRPSQMDFMGERVSRGLFAPAINFHNGTYYVTCTDIDHSGNFVVTATNPAGPWSDPVRLPQAKGIDPSLFFDDDKAYLIYNSDAPGNQPLYDGHRTIRMYEFDAQNLKVTGSEIQLVNGGVDLAKKPVWIEGPHIYKREGYYYLLAAEGGTSVNHSQVAFRSKQVTGPYIPYEKNPVLTQRHLDPNRKNPVTSTGHADLVEGPDGKTYAIFLAVRPYEGDFYNTGRETFIAPVTWVDGWPVINAGLEEVQYSYPVTYQEIKPRNTLPQSGNFSYTMRFKDQLDPSLLFLRTRDTSWYSLSKKNGLTMKLLPATCMESGNPAFIAKRQQHLTCAAATELDFTAQNSDEKAGILIFQDEYHFYYLCKSQENGKNNVQLFKGDPVNKNMHLEAQSELPKGTGRIFLRISADHASYSFDYSENGAQWKPLGEKMDGKFLSTRVAGGFTGSVFALYATSGGKPSDSFASFKSLTYSGNDLVYR